MTKKESLSVGQKVWLETTDRFGCDVRKEDETIEMVVLEANKTSAYIWHEGAKIPSTARFKVNQKTHATQYCMIDGCSYRLWLSKEDYERNVAYEKEMKELLKRAQSKIKTMSLDDLRKFVNMQ